MEFPAIGDSAASNRPLLLASRKTNPLIVGHDESSLTVSSDSTLGADLCRPIRPSFLPLSNAARLLGMNGIASETTDVSRSSDSSAGSIGTRPLRCAG